MKKPKYKKAKHDLKCYMCGEKATSREHVPPLCLFPEEKDIQIAKFRNNLITVPSCDKHNSQKSKDDEFLMASLATLVGNNVIGFLHTQTKVKRALDRKGKDFMAAIMRDIKSVNVKREDGSLFPVLIGRPDFPRLHSCFLHIAYGLYYHKFGQRFDGECRVLIDFLTYENDRIETYKLLCRMRIQLELTIPDNEGNNPDVFRYQFFEPDEYGSIALVMVFYEGAKVFVAFEPKTTKMPFNLSGALIEAGIRTIVSFKEDGSEFEFN